MKTTLRVMLSFVGLFGLVHPILGAKMSASLPGAGDTSEAEVRAVVQAFISAQNAHDLKAVEALLLDSPQFLWITRGTPVWGREAALKRFETLYQGTWHLAPDTAALRLVLEQEHTAQIFLPIVFTIGAPGRSSQQTRFLMTMLLVEVDGHWKVASILPIPAAVPGA
jgi:uncharacterized protein (TIGR02246 family)